MLAQAINHPGPVAIRYPRAEAEKPYHTGQKPGWGEGEVLKEGRDGMVLAAGSMVLPSLRAAQNLEASGLSVGVTDVRFIKPLPAALILKLARSYPRLLTVEDHVLAGGFGSAVIELLSDNGIMLPVKRVGVGDVFVEHASRKEQLVETGLAEEMLGEIMRTYFARGEAQTREDFKRVADAHGR
jgi:1-deoxy-D-xylulose-5-phosphate synthase